nr:hypothetical protein [Tanacetum cinerariifolium]
MTPQFFELITRFCYGFQVNFTPENVILISCFAEYLGLTEDRIHNNLLKQALSFFEHEIITSWNESIRSLKIIESMDIHEMALQLGLVDGCIDLIITKALDNPLLLGEPINGNILESDTTTMPKYGCSLSQKKLMKTHLLMKVLLYNQEKVVIEAIEKLLPRDQGILPCTPFFEMLKYATLVEADVSCREGLERRIGKQLDSANVNDFIILSQGCSKEEKYDSECLKRILMYFYNNFIEQDHSRLVIMAELAEGFLAEVVNDIDLK